MQNQAAADSSEAEAVDWSDRGGERVGAIVKKVARERESPVNKGGSTVSG